MSTNLTTLRGTPTYAAGKFGNALTAGVLGTATTGVWNATVGTVEAWVKTTATTALCAVGNGPVSTAAYGLWLGVNNGKAFWRDATSETESTVIINNDVWHHLAVTYDGSNVRLWVDGALAKTYARASSTMSISSAGTSAIGGLGATTSVDWVGAVDEVRISNVVRYTATFTPPAAAFTLDANTIDLYHLEASGQSAADTNVTPTAPTFTDVSGTASDTYTIPATTGVDYQVGGTTKAAGTYPGIGTVTVNAIAQAGYTLLGTTSWAYAYSAQITAVLPQDANIVYSPYNWQVSAGVAKTINSGAYCRALIQSSTLALTFDMTGMPAETPQIIYSVDGGPATIATMAASISLAIPAGIVWGKHLVEFTVKAVNGIDRWNTNGQSVRFTGFTTDLGAVAHPIQQRALKGVAFGDSITDGARTREPLAAKTFTQINDATLGWAYQAGQQLGAEIGVVGFSSQGWSNTGDGGSPTFANSWNLLWAGQTRSWTVAPDFVVINHGTNGTATQAEIVTVLNAILAAVPTTTRIIVMRPFSGAKAATIQGAVTDVANTRVTYLDTTGWWATADSSDNIHPYGYASVSQLGPRAAAGIKAALPGGTAAPGKRFINKAGTAVAIS